MQTYDWHDCWDGIFGSWRLVAFLIVVAGVATAQILFSYQ